MSVEKATRRLLRGNPKTREHAIQENTQPEETGAEGDKRIEAAAQSGHHAVSNVVPNPPKPGPEEYIG